MLKLSKQDKKSQEYKKFKKEVRSRRLKAFTALFRIRKNKNKPDISSGPDVSTITEHLAFVIDGEVVDIMHCQAKLAAILLSNPEVVNIPVGVYPKPGFKYIDGKFIDNEKN